MGLLFKRGTTANKPTLSNGEIYIDSTKKSITAKADNAEFDAGNTSRMKKIIFNLKNENPDDWSASSIIYSDSSQFDNNTISVGVETLGTFVVTMSIDLDPDENFTPHCILPILYGSDIIYCQYGFTTGGIVLSFFDSDGSVDLEAGTTDLVLTLDYLEAEPT